MNKKNFKIEYDAYMKNIKPSKELIEKTIKIAHQEQENLKQPKNKKFFSFLYNINFRRYSAIACTLLFTLFAVKLWNNISKETVPVEPIQTTTIENSSSDTVENATETTTVSIIESEFTTPNNTDGKLTQTEENIIAGSNTNITYTHQFLDSSNSVTSISDIQNDGNKDSNSTTYNTYDNNSHELQSTITNVPQNTSTLESSTNKTTNTIEQTESAISTTTKATDSQNGGNTTFPVTTLPSESTDYISETDSEENTIGQTETTSIPFFTTTTSLENTITENTTIVKNTTVAANTTNVTTNDSSIETNPDSYEEFVALRVTLYNNSNGFFYNGTIYSDKIKLYFSFGNDMVCVLKLGDTLTDNQCEAILIIKDNNISNNLDNIITELNTSYSYIDITNSKSFQTLSAPKDLDFNGDGIGAQSDILDLASLYDILYIDD